MNTVDIDFYLDSLPIDIEEIDVSYKKINYLPNLSKFTKLKRLYCNHNELYSLPDLNESLEFLSCCHNNLTLLPRLNTNLKKNRSHLI